MHGSHLRTTHPSKSSESLSLQPVPQGPWRSVRFVWQRTAKHASNTARYRQHQTLCLFTDPSQTDAFQLKHLPIVLDILLRLRRIRGVGIVQRW